MVLRALPNASEKQMRYMNVKGSKVMAFPYDALGSSASVIVCCEGVMDALAAEANGLTAFTSTTGVGTFRSTWIDSLHKGVKLAVCFDNDAPGQKGADKVLGAIAESHPNIELYKIELPEITGGKDLNDFLLANSGTKGKEQLLSLMKPIKKMTPQEQLIADLRESRYHPLYPLQAFHHGIGYYAVTLQFHGTEAVFVVTSKRECFPCTEEALRERGFTLARPPIADQAGRWPQQQLLDFLDGAEVLSLADVYQLIVQKIQVYLDHQDARFFSCVALWILATYFYRIFHSFPYLHIHGIFKSGKTKMVQIGVLLGFNGEMLTSTTYAALMRLIHHNGATCGIDEAEKLSAKDESTSTLQEILRSGYKRGGSVPRCEPNADGRYSVMRFDVYSPKIMAGTKPVEAALASRCIQFIMLRSKNAGIANREINTDSAEWADLRGMIYPAALCAFGLVYQTLQTFELQDVVGREAELWRPLLVVAKAADSSGKLFNEVLSMAKEMQRKRQDEDEDSSPAKLISCLHRLLVDEEEKFIPASDIFEALAEDDDDFAWLTDDHNKSKRGWWLNTKLKTLGLWVGRAKHAMVHGKKVRGYVLTAEKLKDAGERYGIVLGTPSVGSIGSPF